MMIAARLAGGNLFLPFWVGDFFERSEHSERLGALGFFLRGFFLRVVGDSFFWGWWGVFWIVSVGKN